MGKWKMVRLGEIGAIITGNTPKTDNPDNYSSNDMYFYKPSDFNDNKVTVLESTENYISNYAKEKARVAPSQSVLVTCIGIIGKVGITTKEASFNQQINAIIPKLEVCVPNFLAYTVLYINKQLNHIANAAVVPIINKNQFANVQIPLPPLPIQQKIATVLDHINILIEKRKEQIKKLDLLVKSHFVGMFGDPVTNPMGWDVKTLQELIDSGEVTYHLDGNHGELYPRIDEFLSKGIPYIGANCISNGKVEYQNAKYLSEERANRFRKGVAVNGDVLFAHNATVGPVAILETMMSKIILSTSLTAYRCDPTLLNPNYLKAYMESSAFIIQYKAEMGQTTRNQVPITKQRGFYFHVPPISLQNRFAAFVQQVDKTKFVMKHNIKQLLTICLHYVEIKRKGWGNIDSSKFQYNS
jgi:type I restriction enzyme S subunit